MHTVPNVQGLSPWVDYWRSRPNIFKSQASANSFVRSRKAYLIEVGLLIPTMGGYLVDAEALDRRLIGILQTADGRPAAKQGEAV